MTIHITDPYPDQSSSVNEIVAMLSETLSPDQEEVFETHWLEDARPNKPKVKFEGQCAVLEAPLRNAADVRKWFEGLLQKTIAEIPE